MSRTLSEEELACLRQTGCIRAGSTRERLISVANILAEYSDESAGLTANEIARCIEACCGCRPSEKAILDDLHAIERGRPFGMGVLPAKTGDNTGFRFTGKPLTADEALTAANLVRASVFMSPGQRDTLAQKLRALASPKETESMDEAIFVDARESYDMADALRTIEVASQAIQRKERVSFRMAEHRLAGESSTGPFEEDPVSLVFSFGRYYLVTVGNHTDVLPDQLFRRIDRIRGIVATGKPLKDAESVKACKKRIPREIQERVEMLGDERTRLIIFKVSGDFAKFVYDRFGHDTEFFGIDEKADTGFTCLKVRASATLYRWLIGMCKGIVLAKPDPRMASYLAGLPWIRATELDCTLLTRLTDDYREVKAGLQALIKQASALYCEDDRAL